MVGSLTPLQPDRQRDEAAARLKTLIPAIMAAWEQAVRGEVPAAQYQERLTLYDDLPPLLAEVAQALAIGKEELCEDSDASKAHAKHRASAREYSLNEVVQEYHILRRVLIEQLQATARLEDEACAVIHGSIDQAIQEAVTEYVRLQQQALRESEERYRLLVEGVKDYAILMLDPEGRVCNWNQGAHRTFGHEVEQIVGHPYACFFTPDDLAAGAPAHQVGEARAHGRHETEGWRVRKDGTQFWASSVLCTLHDNTGELRGFSVVTRDITERKYLEDQMLRKADELALADRRKNEFLAMLAHELRTPLSAISNALYILEALELDQRTVKHLAPIQRQTGHLRRLVDDLLDIARISSGRLDLRREPVAVGEIVEAAAQATRPFIDASQHQLTLSIHAERLLVEGDGLRLEQVVTNLLHNAAKYTEPGGQLFLIVERENQEVAVRVRDSGIGIDPAMLPTVFDLYMQADPSAPRSQSGLGIGLNLVRQLVELHGGSVTATSAGVGKGAEFVVRLPLIERDSSP